MLSVRVVAGHAALLGAAPVREVHKTAVSDQFEHPGGSAARRSHLALIIPGKVGARDTKHV